MPLDTEKYLVALDAHMDGNPDLGPIRDGFIEAARMIYFEINGFMPLVVKVNGVETMGLGVLDDAAGTIRIAAIVPHPSWEITEQVLLKGGKTDIKVLEPNQTLAEAMGR